MEAGHKIVANYMTASAALETYIQQNGAMTVQEEQNIRMTLQTTETLLNRWKRRQSGAMP
jgi:hypothetical protein